MSSLTPEISAAVVTRRDERWRVDVLDYTTEQKLYTLAGVKSGGVFDFSIFYTVRSGGTLRVNPLLATADWPHVKLQPWYTPDINNEDLWWPVGVFIPGTPVEQHHHTAGSEASVEMYDKLLVLVRDKVESTYTVDAGTNPVTAARDVILSTGESKVNFEEFSETLAAPLVWEAGTTKLRIVNDLLEAAGFFAVDTDPWGFYVAQRYRAPRDRGVHWVFDDGPQGITLPEFRHEEDIFDIPNKVVLVGRSADDETPAPSGVAADEDPDSAWSYQNRNDTWVTVTEFDVDATSETVLAEKAARRLLELQQVTSTYEIEHAYLPLPLNAVVGFKRGTRFDALASVQRIRVSMDLGAPVRTTLREVR